MTDNFYSTSDYSNWLNATNGYDIYDGNYTFTYDESYFTTYQNISPTSNNNGTDPNEFVLPWWRQILWSILFGGMVIVSTVGNLIVIWIVLAHKRMRTPTNYFLVNLSIADAMVSTLNVTFSFTYMLNSHWPFGTLYCKISQFVAILSIGASVFTLMAIAIDRCCCILHSESHAMSSTPETTTEVSHSTKKENKETTIITTNRTPTTGSNARTKRPKNSKLTIPNRKSLDNTNTKFPDTDYKSPQLPESENSIELNNHRSFRTSSPKRKSKSTSKSSSKHGCDSREADDSKLKNSATERRLETKITSRKLKSTTLKPKLTNEHVSTTLSYEASSISYPSTLTPDDEAELQSTENSATEATAEPIYHDFRRHSHENYDIECDSSESDSDITFTNEQSTLPVQTENKIDDTVIKSTDEAFTQQTLEENTSVTYNTILDYSTRTSSNLQEKSTVEISAVSEPLPLTTTISLLEGSTIPISTISEPSEAHTFEISVFNEFLDSTTTTKYLDTSTVQLSTISESLRRMSESEEMSTECDSVEELKIDTTTKRQHISTITSSPEHDEEYSSTTPIITLYPETSEEMISTKSNTNEILQTRTSTTLNTDSMRRMSESEEVVTDCDSDQVTDKTDTTITQQSISPTKEKQSPTTSIKYTYTDPTIAASTSIGSTGIFTTPNPVKSTIGELSRRMSESDEDCEYDEDDVIAYTPQILTSESASKDSKFTSTKPTFPPQTSSRTSPITVAPMRRMSDSDESSTDCNIVLTTMAPIEIDSMRRMSQFDAITTELSFDGQTEAAIVYEDVTEFVTECETEEPITKPTVGSRRNKESKDKKDKANKNAFELASLPCCPDPVCSLLYPNVSSCNVRRSNAVNNLKMFNRTIVELRDLFYIYKTQVLITKLTDDHDAIKKRRKYENRLVSLWNETFSSHMSNHSCTNNSSDHNVNATITSIYCFLNTTKNLSDDNFLNMILDVVKRAESVFPNKKTVKYSKLRRIILQSLPKILDDSDEIQSLSDFMQENRDYEKEQKFLLKLLLNIQKRNDTEATNMFTETEESSDNQRKTETTDSPESLQKNGLGISMHRQPK